MKTILITGINGFLGSYLAKSLSLNHRIIGLEYSLENLFRLENTTFRLYSTKNSNWIELFEEYSIDIIIHTATIYGKNNEDIRQIVETNFNMPFHLLNMAIKNKVSLFVNTDTVLDRFVSPYALTKRQFQEWLYLCRFEIMVINMKLEHFYGPDASQSNFISNMIRHLKSNVHHIDLTEGKQVRDFVYIDDVCDAFQTVIKNKNIIIEEYTDIQVATNQLITIKELILYLKEITGSNSILNFGAIPYRENELMFSENNNTALVSLGWNPIHDLKTTLIDLI